MDYIVFHKNPILLEKCMLYAPLISPAAKQGYAALKAFIETGFGRFSAKRAAKYLFSPMISHPIKRVLPTTEVFCKKDKTPPIF